MLVSFSSWKSSVIDNVMRVLMVIGLSTDLGKSFHKANISMVLISESNLSVEHIWDAHVTRPLNHEVYVQGTKLVKLIYRPVFVSFWKIVIASSYNWRPKEWGSSFSNVTVNRKFFSNLSRMLCTWLTFSGFINNKVSSTKWQ